MLRIAKIRSTRSSLTYQLTVVGGGALRKKKRNDNYNSHTEVRGKVQLQQLHHCNERLGDRKESDVGNGERLWPANTAVEEV